MGSSDNTGTTGTTGTTSDTDTNTSTNESTHSARGSRNLPKTAGELPLVGLAGLLALGLGAGFTLYRRRSA